MRVPPFFVVLLLIALVFAQLLQLQTRNFNNAVIHVLYPLLGGDIRGFGLDSKRGQEPDHCRIEGAGLSTCKTGKAPRSARKVRDLPEYKKA